MSRNKKPKKENAEYLGQQIDYTHRWLVRGHWRQASGIGKNRAGDYCVKGATWVVDHQKGPENKPLVSNKIRIAAS